MIWRLGVVLPACLSTWKVEIGGLCSDAGLGKSARPYLKNKLKKQKGWGRGRVSSSGIVP
jgi:hypothetical protein